MPIHFDLLPFAQELKITNREKGPCYLDLTRKVYLSVTPEEGVRQSLIAKLIRDYNIPIGLMRTEYEIKKNGLKKRTDLIIFNNNGEPQMIIETKAPSVKLTQKTMDQVAFYNNVIFAPWLLISNGIMAMIYHIDFETKTSTEVLEFPLLKLR
ncbi:MAG: type I restriction enzyme HsdR N-terminal domain-containing protein [Saprospiraceae bacterium]|jgi:hypothetical protein|uniref:type I restriction enzyme HsdR N-terminal domain-containing protein n=1 Tax=Candidatus Brachybacter algidus TaxID=2982024 RepID=UPI001B4C0613|nr:type I restriction enzyme HsdR N-terminal domain-containing protein [Candidatus Brachybacter algidus]MBP7304626.1 type I restriction enzyme HsdR N-terminal domain-containing protein [Saprospiraceae bacterium]MBK6372705.1 type I restriction enzyme HsdR N-terminal domain-containing protein [Candidatus Brachybacter algidus]MBK6448324.1 type I restriction enzyme HsdR N-terminal domain-containing protein [Candidatus Brachybacter algidus]MBK8602644.1 type I restriction enzyme HsdR N-terminal domai